MVKVIISNISGIRIPYEKSLTKLLQKVLSSNKNRLVNLIFCNNIYIRKLNSTFLGLDKTTDVLSFLYEEPDILGEIYISAEKAMKQASHWNNSFYRELRRLIVHGGLHLIGYDHKKPKERCIMRLKEESYLER